LDLNVGANLIISSSKALPWLCLCTAVFAQTANSQTALPNNQLRAGVYGCDVNETRAALDAGADPNSVVRLFLGAELLLQTAIRQSCVQIVQELLAHGANPDGLSEGLFSSQTPLMAAAQNGNIDIVKLLLKYKAQVNFGSGSFLGETALTDAVVKKQTAVAE
jgi:ankyrin repeat protein